MPDWRKMSGRLEVKTLRREPAAVMKSAKGCALLIYLLVTQKTYSREALADMLWEANSTKESLHNLRQLLVRGAVDDSLTELS